MHCKGATRRYVHRGTSDPTRDSHEKNKNQDAFGVKEVMQIIRDLHILSRAIETGIASAGGVGSDAYFALSPSRCLVWSTIIMVMDLYSCPEHVSSSLIQSLPLQGQTYPVPSPGVYTTKTSRATCLKTGSSHLVTYSLLRWH